MSYPFNFVKKKMTPPSISTSSREERRAFVAEQWECQNHCPSCGKCAILKGKDPEELYADYIEGKRSYFDVSLEVRKR